MRANSSIDDIFFSKRAVRKSLVEFIGKANKRYGYGNSPDELNYQDLMMHRKSLLPLLLKEVKNKSFCFSPSKMVAVDSDKLREIQKFSVLDSFLLHHFAKSLEPIAESNYSDRLFSFRKGYSPFQCIQNLADYLKGASYPLQGYQWDLKNFGGSLLHQEVLKQFEQIADPSEPLVRLLQELLQEVESISSSQARGLPTGSYLQLIFENLYLSDLDAALSELNGFYARFGDDILFLSPCASELQKANSLATASFENLGLELNHNKTKRIVLAADGSPHLDYLGYRVDLAGRILLPRKKIRKIQKFIKNHLWRVRQNLPEVEISPEEWVRLLIKSFNSLLGKNFEDSPLHTYLHLGIDQKQIRELDSWIIQVILKLAYQSGFNRKSWKLYKAHSEDFKEFTSIHSYLRGLTRDG